MGLYRYGTQGLATTSTEYGVLIHQCQGHASVLRSRTGSIWTAKKKKTGLWNVVRGVLNGP